MDSLAIFSFGWAIVLCASSSAVITVLLSILGRLWPLEARQRHNDVAGFMISVIAVIYAILLGFVTFTVWENYDKASAAVDTEVNLVADIHRDVESLPPGVAIPIRQSLVAYLRLAIDQEWPAQMAGRCEAPKRILNDISRYLHGTVKLNPDAAAFTTEIVSRLNQLYDARRERLFACHRSVPAPIWTALVGGSICLIGFSLFFGCHSQRMHMLMSSMLASSIALVLWIIVDLSMPFQGSTAISSQVYQEMLDFLRMG